MTPRPKALDLFCCAGGASKGLHNAGFDVTGVDIRAQAHYPFRFIQADALTFPLERYDFIWASPPCQAFTTLRWMPTAKQYPNLIPAVRSRLLPLGTPFCIENVEGAPLGSTDTHLIMLCGTMFGLGTRDGRAELRRHRLFETNFSIALRPACQHGYGSIGSLSVCGDYAEVNANRKRAKSTVTVCGDSVSGKTRKVLTVCGHTPVDNTRRRAITITGSTAQTNTLRNKMRETFTVKEAREAMMLSRPSLVLKSDSCECADGDDDYGDED